MCIDVRVLLGESQFSLIPLLEFCVIGLIVRIGKVCNYNSPYNFSLVLFTLGEGLI